MTVTQPIPREELPLLSQPENSFPFLRLFTIRAIFYPAFVSPRSLRVHRYSASSHLPRLLEVARDRGRIRLPNGPEVLRADRRFKSLFSTRKAGLCQIRGGWRLEETPVGTLVRPMLSMARRRHASRSSPLPTAAHPPRARVCRREGRRGRGEVAARDRARATRHGSAGAASAHSMEAPPPGRPENAPSTPCLRQP